MKFYTVEKLSQNREKTPEGYLLCRDTPISRTGTQMYGPDETPIKPGKDGVVWIDREPDDVFSPASIASANGKSLCNDHPDNDVDPKNWRELTVGVVLNPRRGEGSILGDLLLCDLLVTTQEGIDLIQSDKTELSVGYDAEYEEIAPGHGRQKNIIINHVALVDQGRCGPACRVSDHKKHAQPCSCNQEKSMTKTVDKGARIMDMLRRAFKAKDENSLAEIAKEADGDAITADDGGDTHVHVHLNGNTKEGDPDLAGNKDTKTKDGEMCTKDEFDEHVAKNETEHKAMRDSIEELKAKLGEKSKDDSMAAEGTMDEKEIEGELKEEAPEGTGDKAAKAKDSVYLEDSFQAAASLAEIIVPGISIPTFDRAAAPKKSLDAVCALRRKTLDLAWGVADTRGMIEDVMGGKRPDVQKMRCSDLRTLFNAVGAAKKRSNSSTRNRDDNTGGGLVPVGTPRTIADLNRMNADYYGVNKH